MNMRQMLSLLIALVMIAPAQANEWLSTADSQFRFETTIEGVTTPGEFTRFQVTFNFEPTSHDDSHLRVTVDLTAADLGDPEMNAVLFDPAWFDTEHFVEAVFESCDIIERSSGEYLANGTLDLKGTRKLVAVPFSWASAGDTATMGGELLLDRTEFDVGSGEWASDDAIGSQVKLVFALQLEHQN